jgi:hypothetical protein
VVKLFGGTEAARTVDFAGMGVDSEWVEEVLGCGQDMGVRRIGQGAFGVGCYNCWELQRALWSAASVVVICGHGGWSYPAAMPNVARRRNPRDSSFKNPRAETSSSSLHNHASLQTLLIDSLNNSMLSLFSRCAEREQAHGWAPGLENPFRVS